MLMTILKFFLATIFLMFGITFCAVFVIGYAKSGDLFPLQKYGLMFVTVTLALLPFLLPPSKKKTLLKVSFTLGLSSALAWALMIGFATARFPTLLACILFTAVSLRKWDEVFPNKKEVQAH